MKYEVRYDIPRPSRSYRHNDKEYPFAEMKVGGAFVIDFRDITMVRSAMNRFERKHPGWKFSCHLRENDAVIFCDMKPRAS